MNSSSEPWSTRPGNAERIIAARQQYPSATDAWIARTLEAADLRSDITRAECTLAQIGA